MQHYVFSYCFNCDVLVVVVVVVFVYMRACVRACVRACLYIGTCNRRTIYHLFRVEYLFMFALTHIIVIQCKYWKVAERFLVMCVHYNYIFRYV